MKEPQTKLPEVLNALQQELQPYKLTVCPYSIPDDPAVTHFIYILHVPVELLHETSMRAWELALDVLGDASATFLMSAIDPEYSAELLSKGE